MMQLRRLLEKHTRMEDDNNEQFSRSECNLIQPAALLAVLKTKTHVKKRKEDTDGTNRPDYESNK